jgi:hypothetical protein
VLFSGSEFFWNFAGNLCIFSASPWRWSKLLQNMKENTGVVKPLSDTRWSARNDTTNALFVNYSEIRQAFSDIAESERQPPAAVREAKSLMNKVDRFETALMCVIWKDLLQNIDIVNKDLQEPGIELCTTVKLYDSLLAHFQIVRNKFDVFETMARKLTSSNYKECVERKRTRSSFADEVLDNTDPSLSLSASIKFRAQSFYPIIDRLITEMTKRR